jgi:hypothetical protein
MTTWVKVLIVAAILAACAIAVNRFLSYEQNIGYQKAAAEYSKKLIAAQDDARAQEQAWQAQQKKSQVNYSMRVILSTSLLSILLAGCATPSTPSAAACPLLPLPPVAQESTPLVPYLDSVLTLSQKWESTLKASASTR